MRQLTSLALLLGLLVCLPKPVSAQTPYVFTTEHVDIDIRYGGSPAAWEIGWHDEDNNIEYSATEALVFALPASMVTRPAGSQWDFLGTPAGNNLWILPQSQNPNLVYLGVGAEEIQPGIFSSYLETDPRINANGVWIRLDLKSV
ncbi:MAG TPA: hypothetical protein PKD72_06710, partial [Gemmatales bacterium]|nr:hypothetical protein [Gemmatales bacterium]